MANKTTDSPVVNNSSSNELGDILLQINFADPQKIRDKETGRKLGSRIYRQQSNLTESGYYGKRTLAWQENYSWALGKQNMNEFKDFVSISGNKAYTNIDFTPTRKGAELTETLVTFLSSNDEYPFVDAVDDKSLDDKGQQKKDALFRMHDNEKIAEMEKIAGVNFEPPNAYTPEDELEANVKFELDFKLLKEIDFQKKLWKIMNDNNYPQLKRRIYRDLIVVNCGCTKIEKMEDGFVYIRPCIPGNLIYNFFLTDNGKMELRYIGEVYSMKIKDIRIKFGKSESRPNGLSEKEIFLFGKTATQYNISNKFYWSWTESYIYSLDRPYDDFSIEVFDFEISVPDADYYVSKTDSFGKENIAKKKSVPTPQPAKEVMQQDKFRWYRGVWAIKSDKMLYWGLPDVVVSPYMDITQSLSSYTIQIPNNDGEYVPSLFERALEPLREYTLAKLKRKQLLANLVPAGYSIDVEGVRDVDLGNGNTIGYEEVIKIYNQTGRLVWSSKGIDPTMPQEVPIRGLANAESFAQLNELTMVIDKCDAEMRSLMGVSIYLQGQQVGDRTAATLANQQRESSSNVFGFIEQSYLQLMEETLNKCCMLKWDEEVLNKDNDELMDTVFQVSVKLKIKEYEKTLLEQMINVAMQEQLLDFKDAFRVRQIDDFKLANLYLADVTAKNKKQKMAEVQQNAELNAKAQQDSLAMSAKSAQDLETFKAQVEIQKQDATARAGKEIAATTAIFNMYSTGMAIPTQLTDLANALIESIQIPTILENAQSKMAIMKGMQQAQPPPQEQQETQQGMQEQPQQEQPQEQMEQQPMQ